MAKKAKVSIRRIQRQARREALPPEPVAALDTLVYRAELGGVTTLRDGRKLQWDRHVRLVPKRSALDLCSVGGCHMCATPEQVAERYDVPLEAVHEAIASGDLSSSEYRATADAEPEIVVVLDRDSRRALRAATATAEPLTDTAEPLTDTPEA